MKNIEQTEFESILNLQANTVILDVRTAGEIQEGIIENAKHIDIMGSDFQSEIEKLDKSAPYIVVCRSGNRSGKACQIMDASGFEITYNLLGGMMNWKGATVNP